MEEVKGHKAYAADYIGFWAYAALQFLVCALPIRAAYFIADKAGDIMFAFSRKTRMTVEGNLRTALKADEALIKKYTREIFRNFCRNLVEFLSFSKFDERWFKKHGETVGIENIKKALNSGRGVVAISLHMGNWELGAYMTLLCGVPVNGIWASHKNPRIEEFFIKPRIEKGLKVILTGGAMKQALNALQSGELVCFVIDHSYSKSGIEVEFLGQKTIIPRGAAVAALKTNAAIFPVVAIRGKGMKHKLFYGEEIMYSLSGDEEKDIHEITSKCAKTMERFIRENPGQWLLFRKYWSD